MTESIKYVLFKLNEEIFAVDVSEVLSIERLEQVTTVPRASKFIKGIMEIRGKTTAIIDLKDRLNLAHKENTEDTRILVVSLDGIQIGFIVDAAIEVRDISDDSIENPPEILAGVQSAFLHGVTKIDDRLILILNLKKVLDLQETNEVKEVLEEV